MKNLIYKYIETNKTHITKLNVFLYILEHNKTYLHNISNLNSQFLNLCIIIFLKHILGLRSINT